MTPLKTKSMLNSSDRQFNDPEFVFGTPLQQEVDVVFHEMDKDKAVEASSYSNAPRRVVSTETASGEPISPRDLFSSDRAFALAEAASHEQIERATALRNLGQRLESLREEF